MKTESRLTFSCEAQGNVQARMPVLLPEPYGVPLSWAHPLVKSFVGLLEMGRNQEHWKGQAGLVSVLVS
jgi:hypothetical protein